MIKNIGTMTEGEFLREQIKKGMVPTCPIKAGVKINIPAPSTSTNERHVGSKLARSNREF